MTQFTAAVPVNDTPAMTSQGFFSTVWYRFFQIVAQYEVQIGDMAVQGAGGVNQGWLKCNGQAISRTAYADLFAVIGTAYGIGDGNTTFNVPNIAGPGGASFWKIAFQ